ncbi:hypothetical protein ACFQGT_00345 [Natrialbaceae archaeon GCM10025810]
MTDETHEIEVELSEKEAKMLDALKEVMGVESRSEVLSEIAHQRLGEIHPDALAESGVDIESILSGETDPSDVPEKYKKGNYGTTEVAGDE